MKTFKQITIAFLLFLPAFSMFALIAHAQLTIPAVEVGKSAEQTGLVNCGTQSDASGKITNPCNFAYGIDLMNRLMGYMIYITASIAVVVFSYAGILVLTAGGNAAKLTQAKSMAWKVLVGMFFMIGAYLVVKYIQDNLLNTAIGTYVK